MGKQSRAKRDRKSAQSIQDVPSDPSTHLYCAPILAILKTAYLKGIQLVKVISGRVLAFMDCLAQKLHVPTQRAATYTVTASVTFGVGMISVNEYLVAMLCWGIALIVSLSKAIHWKGFDAYPRLTVPSKIVWACVSIGFCAVLFYWAEIKRGDEPWSIFAGPKSERSAQLKTAEKEPDAEETKRLAPQLFIDLSIRPSEGGPYKPPLKRYSLALINSNRNIDAAPILGLRMKFNFKNTLTEVKTNVTTGNAVGNEFYRRNKDGSVTQEYLDVPQSTELSKKFELTIQQAIIKDERTNLNVAELYVEKWPERAIFVADFIVDMSMQQSYPFETQRGVYNGWYSYEIRGKKFTETVSGSIRD